MNFNYLFHIYIYTHEKNSWIMLRGLIYILYFKIINVLYILLLKYY